MDNVTVTGRRGGFRLNCRLTNTTENDQCCGEPCNIDSPPSKEEDLRLWLKPLKTKPPPKRPAPTILWRGSGHHNILSQRNGSVMTP
ncbi:hypothetical protein NFI96_019604, partial [Prochilodus magdalenae]